MIISPALAVTLASTVAWSTFDVVRKFLVRRIDVVVLSVWISLAQLPGFVVWALVDGQGIGSTEYLPPALASVALNIVANLLFLEAVRIGHLSVTIPLLSFTPVFAALLGIPLLGELLRQGQWLGVVFVICGAFLLNAEPRALRRPWTLVTALFRERGASYMLAVALLWALSPILDKLALRHAGVGLHASVLSGGVALGMATYLAVRGELGRLALSRESFGLLALGGVSAVAALGLQLLAIRVVLVSLFEAVKRALGMVLSVFFGRVFFREPVSFAKVLAILFMSTGISFVLELV